MRPVAAVKEYSLSLPPEPLATFGTVCAYDRAEACATNLHTETQGTRRTVSRAARTDKPHI